MRTRKRMMVPILLTLLTSVWLGACGSDSGGAQNAASGSPSASAAPDRSGSGGTLVIGMTAGNVPLPNTPPDQGFEGRRFVGYQIYDALFRWTNDQGDTVPEVVPALAESYTVSDDKLAWTFKLRQGVKFHDGTPFNADSVVFQMRRISDKSFEFYDAAVATNNSSNIGSIAKVEKVDDFTVKFTTKAVNALLPYDLVFVYYPSPDVVKKYGNAQYQNHATGTGPFKMTKYVDGQVMEMDANVDYWGGRPKLDKIVLKPMPEPATRLAALQSGDVNWAELPPPDAVELLKSSGYQVILKEYPHVITYQLNLNKPALKDVRVRQALNYAMDKKGLATLINGVGEPSLQYMYKSHPYYDPSWEGFSYDAAKAKKLLADAGYGSGLKLKIAYPTGGSGNMFPGPMNEKFKQDLKAVGVEVELVPLEWNTIISGFRAGFGNSDWSQYDGIYFSTAPISPISAFRSYTTDYIPPKGCCNTTGYSNPVADKLYAEAAASFDPAKQTELLRQFQSTMMKDAPVITTVHDMNLRALAPSVKGFVQPQSWFADLNQVWIKK